MKYFIRLMLALAVLSTSQVALAAGRVFPLKPEYAFTPKGFDANDNAQVVIAGAFSDYCMKVGTTHHRVDALKKIIYIDQTYTTNNDCNDIEMYIPYSIEVNLGPIPAGNYDVMLLDIDHRYTKMSTLPIAAAKQAANGQSDERLYAPVNSIDYRFIDGTNSEITIKGVFSNTCMSLQTVEVNQREGDVFEILPIAVDQKKNCTASAQRFTQTVHLNGFSMRNSLIHVRTMSGQAINKVITTLDRVKE